jgi:hypothetical protein
MRQTTSAPSTGSRARPRLGDDIADELRFVAPDFAAVVEAAHARDPRRVPFAALVEAQDLAPVVPLADSSPRLSARQSAEFIALLADARAEIDAATPRRSPDLRTCPSEQVVAPLAVGPRRRRRRPARRLGPVDPRDPPGPQPRRRQPGPVVGARRRHRPRGRTPVPEPAPRPTREPRKSPDPEPTPEVEPEPASTPEPAITPEPDLVEPVQKTSKRPPRETLADKLRRLDAEAESAWQSGDVATAELRYREIIKLAPGSRAADLGYGDLFALSRQRSGPDAEEALWREYLAAFPRGRYADDARAGLCRRARADARGACWQQYLADFPNGVHRTQATRALAQ